MLKYRAQRLEVVQGCLRVQLVGRPSREITSIVGTSSFPKLLPVGEPLKLLPLFTEVPRKVCSPKSVCSTLHRTGPVGSPSCLAPVLAPVLRPLHLGALDGYARCCIRRTQFRVLTAACNEVDLRAPWHTNA